MVQKGQKGPKGSKRVQKGPKGSNNLYITIAILSAKIQKLLDLKNGNIFYTLQKSRIFKNAQFEKLVS